MLITAKEVINEVLPNKNLDPNLLEDSLRIAELKYIKKALGNVLFDMLETENDNQTFSGLNKTLLTDYVKPALARYVVYEALPFIQAEVTNNGLQLPDLDYSTPADNRAFSALRNKLLSDAELFVDEMKYYLEQHRSHFPDYQCSKNISDKILPFLY